MSDIIMAKLKKQEEDQGAGRRTTGNREGDMALKGLCWRTQDIYCAIKTEII